MDAYLAAAFAIAFLLAFVWLGVVNSIDREATFVVRCKDCAVPHNRWTGCPKMNGTVMPPDGFCSFGERRDDKWVG